MGNPATLKPFGKGHDPRRNLKGRPKGSVSSLKKILERELKKEVFVNGKMIPTEEALTMRLIEDARKGKLAAAHLLFKYLYGKPLNYCPNCAYEESRSNRKKIGEADGQKEEAAQLEERKKKAKKFMQGLSRKKA